MRSPFLEKLVSNPELVTTLTAVLWPAEFVGENELEPSTDGTSIDIKRVDGKPLTAENDSTVAAALKSFETNMMAHLSD